LFAVAVLGAPAALAQSTPAPAPLRLTLDQAVERALARHPNAVVAAQEIERAHALVEQARAASLPSITVNGTLTRLDANRLLGANTIAAQNQQSANVNLTVPIVAPQRWVQWSHAKTGVETAQAAARDARRSLALATARAYLAVISQKRSVDLNTRALATDRAHYEFAHARLVGGVGTRMDDVRAAQQVASDEAQLSSSYTALARAREALGVLVAEDQPIDVVDDVALAGAPTDPDEAIRRRPDVAAARARVHAADQNKRDNWADYMPLVSAQFQPFYQHPASISTPETGWQATLVLSLPLYEGGLRRGQAHERQTVLDEARTQYEALLRQTRSDLRVAVEEIRRAEEALKSATSASQLAHQALALANLAYQAGATTNLEVIDAERRARDADTAAIIVEDNIRQARLDLLAAAGQFP
jgi:outer membrane protein TolC